MRRFIWIIIGLAVITAIAQIVSSSGHMIVTPAGSPIILNPTVTAFNFTWTPPSYTTGEVTGYQIGFRTGGSPGTYSLIVPLNGPTVSNVIAAQILPGLSPGTYYAAIQSLGPTPSAWSSEVSFLVP